jgi:sugar lactone lactonase YvrE
MKEPVHGRSWLSSRRGASTLGIIVPIAIAALAWGCSDDDNGSGATPPDAGGGDSTTGTDGGTPGPVDDGKLTQVSPAATGGTTFTRPADSTPDPSGGNVYFTAIADDGASGVFKVPAAGGGVTKVFTGSPLVNPLGISISTDGNQLFIADPAAETEADRGGIYVVAVAGGTPAALGGTDGYSPKSVTVVGTTLYFSGIDKANGQPGVFKMPAAGGNIEVVVEGGSIMDPSGVAATASGDVYFADSSSASGMGVLYKVAGGAATAMGPKFGAGFPSGIALSGDGKFVLVSAINQTSYTDEVLRIDVGSGAFTSNNAGPIGMNIEAGGVHRAHAANVYSWADSLAGGGTVYVLKP